MAASAPHDSSAADKIPASWRLMSVDALRGFDMFWILGGDYIVRSFVSIHGSPLTRSLAEQMEHYPWAGFHFYDLIFPLFIFIVGISLVFSLGKMLEKAGRAATVKRIVARSVVLFLLGIFYMGGIAGGFHNVYLAGVLHRIAVAYFFAALLYCFFSPRSLAWVCAGLLIGYWALLAFVPVPGVAVPTLAEPGKNLAHYLDDQFLPGQKFEGTLLSTMGAVANCLIGIFAGFLLKDPRIDAQRKVRWLVIGGAVSLALGFIWSLEFPIIKLLWTSSYVLVACGYGALLLALFYQVIEIWKWRAWCQPLVWIGMNALPVYIIAGAVNFRRLSERFVGGNIKSFLGPFGDLALALVSVGIALCLVNFLYRRKIFLRL